MRTLTKIVVIHDGLIPKVDPLLVELRIKFGENEVIHFENSNEGLEYVLNNISQKMIVLLDINFSHGELSGSQVFENIREKTSLIYVIMITARSFSELKSEELASMINNDALAIENVFKYPEIVKLVEAAFHKLDVRVDCVLEQWINRHTFEERATPYITTVSGKTYSLDDLKNEIRMQSEFGKEMERNILLLAIDLLTRGKQKLDD